MIIESIVKNCELIQKRELDSLCMSEEVDDGSKRMLEVERDEVGLNAKIVLMEPGVHKVELVATEVVVIDVSTWESVAYENTGSSYHFFAKLVFV